MPGRTEPEEELEGLRVELRELRAAAAESERGSGWVSAGWLRARCDFILGQPVRPGSGWRIVADESVHVASRVEPLELSEDEVQATLADGMAVAPDRPPLRCLLGFHTQRRSQGVVGYSLRPGCDDLKRVYEGRRTWTRYVPEDESRRREMRPGGLPGPGAR